MIDSLLFLALPYVALIVCLIGTIFRIKQASLTYSAQSSQFLESRSLLWGSVPWHIGIILVLTGHILALFCPTLWATLVSTQTGLYIVETLGLSLGLACAFGLIVLIFRRLTVSKIQVVTTGMDLAVLFLLLAQVILGLLTAVSYKWGALWSTGTATPYVISILTMRPDISYVIEMPIIIKSHIVLAWLLILLIPFSRLIHIFATPLSYLFRAPQKVVWNNPRHFEAQPEIYVSSEARRYFLQGSIGVVIGGILLSIGAMDKIFKFFFGPRLTSKEETELMSVKLKRLEQTAEQKKLELERKESNFILIAALSDLNESEGKYFTDFDMQPALAFAGKDGYPILISAKCTHLGCTVGNTLNAEGKILCPCHVSFFDIYTGMPNPDSPAKAPLPHVNWAVMDRKGRVIAAANKVGKVSGELNLLSSMRSELNLYVSKEEVEVG